MGLSIWGAGSGSPEQAAGTILPVKPVTPVKDIVGYDPTLKPITENTHMNPTVQPVAMPKANVSLQQTQQPNLQDYIREAQKLGTDQFNAQAQALKPTFKQQNDDLARTMYGQNAGVSSGIGRDVMNRALAEQGGRLETISQGIASQQGLEALNRKYNLDTNLMNMQHDDLKSMYQDAKAGNFDPNTANQIAAKMLGVDINTPEGQKIALGFLNDPQVKAQITANDMGIQYDPSTSKYYTKDAKGSTRELTGAEVAQMAQYGGYEGWRRATSKLVTANTSAYETIEKEGMGNREEILNIMFNPQFTTPEARKQAVTNYLWTLHEGRIANAGLNEGDLNNVNKAALEKIKTILSTMTFDETNVSGGGGLV